MFIIIIILKYYHIMSFFKYIYLGPQGRVLGIMRVPMFTLI